MPYASDRDRSPELLELEQTTWPAPPLNVFLTAGVQSGVYDLLWDDPSSRALNSRFRLVGVNVYRSFNSEFGPFERITDLPVGSTFWRDQTDNVVEFEEVVRDDCWILRGVDSADIYGPRYVFRTLRRPIVKSGSQGVFASSGVDVQVFVDGVQATISRVDGVAGEIELDSTAYPDVATQKLVPAVLPSPTSKVTVTYRYNRSLLRTDLMQRVFYRVTAVGVPSDPTRSQEMAETPLEYAAATSNYEIEKIDWAWREAVRRNSWILGQGGERVKVFLRKTVGEVCTCYRARDYKQPLNDCLRCFGTGILGGYEGPYDMLLAPDDSERTIDQTVNGRTVIHSYEVWTGPRPILSHRDFVVKLNGERYSIGAVRFPTNRGMVLQQHFNIGHLDQADIRYQVPIDNPRLYLMNQLQPQNPPEHAPAQITDKPNIPDEREIRGRTVTWENITW